MSNKTESLAKRVWETLSVIDVSSFTEKKQNLTYLSWANAWQVMCQHYPDTDYTFAEIAQPDGTVMVECAVTVRESEESLTRTMWLPVMDYRNKAIPNPDAFAVNTARMRCLTKCLSMLGLGVYIYAGEDLPRAVVEQNEQPIDPKQVAIIGDLIKELEVDEERFCKAFSIKSIDGLKNVQFDQALAMLHKKKAKMEAEVAQGE